VGNAAAMILRQDVNGRKLVGVVIFLGTGETHNGIMVARNHDVFGPDYFLPLRNAFGGAVVVHSPLYHC
jgi:hypothetical protein